MNRRIVIVALAVVLALVGTGAVYAYVHKADQRAIAGTQAAKVLVVDKRVPAGTTWDDLVKGKYAHADKVPADAAPSNAVADLNASIPLDDVAGSDIAAGQIVVRQMFGPKTAVTGALSIPGDKMAVSVSIANEGDVAGFVQSQSEVAVFATYLLKNGQNGDPDTYITKLLIPRAQVLATSQDPTSDVNGGSGKSGGALSGGGSSGNVLVTLALSQSDAQRVMLSQKIGQIYLSLLSSDSVSAPDDGVFNKAVLNPQPLFK